jgi:hypothetical protein
MQWTLTDFAALIGALSGTGSLIWNFVQWRNIKDPRVKTLFSDLLRWDIAQNQCMEQVRHKLNA